MFPPFKNRDPGLGKERDAALYQNDVGNRHEFSISTLPVAMPLSGMNGCRVSVEGDEKNSGVRNENIFARNGMCVSSPLLVFLPFKQEETI